MALIYDHLFHDIGVMINEINTLYSFAATTLPASATAIHDELIDAADDGDGALAARYDVLSGIPEIFTEWQSTVSGWTSALGDKIAQRLVDVDTVLQQLNMPLDGSASIYDVLLELRHAMVLGGIKDVDASTITLAGSDANKEVATAAATTFGNGKVYLNRTLDGYSVPGDRMINVRDYAYDRANDLWPGEGAGYVGEESQLSVASETVTLTCIADSETDGTADGGETFDIVGNTAGSSPYDWEAEGSGTGSPITVMNGSGLVVDGEFENFTANDPDSWTIDSGAAGTHVFGNSGNEWRGSKCLELQGDGAQATIQISQDASANLIPLKRYCLAFWLKTSGAGLVAGDLTVQFEGTGYTAPTVEKIVVAQAVLDDQVAYTTVADGYYCFINMPAIIPDDFELVIKVENTLTNGESIYIDGLALGEVQWHNGLGIAILAGGAETTGADPFILGDRFTYTVANDDAGTFQRFFRKYFGIQMPSVTDASETIDDAWAEPVGP